MWVPVGTRRSQRWGSQGKFFSALEGHCRPSNVQKVANVHRPLWETVGLVFLTPTFCFHLHSLVEWWGFKRVARFFVYLLHLACALLTISFKLMTILWGMLNYFPPFIHEEIESKREVKPLAWGHTAGIWIQPVNSQGLTSLHLPALPRPWLLRAAGPGSLEGAASAPAMSGHEGSLREPQPWMSCSLRSLAGTSPGPCLPTGWTDAGRGTRREQRRHRGRGSGPVRTAQKAAGCGG